MTGGHFKKDIAILSQWIQWILLGIHQYRVEILYKPGPKIFIADWLSHHNNEEGKDKPIKDMDIRIDAIQSATDIPECVSTSQIQQATAQNENLQYLKKHYNYRLAECKGWASQWLKTILLLQRWPGSNRWSGHEEQMHNHMCGSKTTGVGSAPSQPHGYWKNKATHVLIGILGQY